MRARATSSAPRSRATCNASGSRAPARPRGPAPRSRSGFATSPTRCLSGADGWMFDGEDALGQVSTMSLDNQRNLKLAIHRDPRFLAVAEQVAGEMNKWATGFFGKPIIADWRKQLRFHDQDLSRSRPASRRPARPQRRRLRLLGVDRRRHALHRQQPSAPDRFRRVDRPVSAEDPDRRRSGAVERHPDLARAAAWSRDRHDQGLRARRADRGVLPADGDSRRARPALCRLQHRPVGLHQQRVGRGRVGSAVSSTRTSTRSR